MAFAIGIGLGLPMDGTGDGGVGPTQPLFELESGLGTIALEAVAGSIELES